MVNYFRPAYVTPKILDSAGLILNDIDVFEFHEAFAVILHLQKVVLNSIYNIDLNILAFK